MTAQPDALDPLDAFAARAAYRARLWHAGGISLHDATDDLEADARRFQLDTDAAQAIMSAAFKPYRDKPMTTKNVFDFPKDGTPFEPQAESREREDTQARKGNGQGEEQHDFEIRDDDSDVVLLDRRDPMRSARELVAARFTDDRAASPAALAPRHLLAVQERPLSMRRRLHQERQCGVSSKWPGLTIKGNPPFKPTGRTFSDVIDALSSVCYLDSHIDPPSG